MRRNNLKNFIYNGEKNATSQALMYQHMSNHYRKILNAKKAVDSSTPLYFKPRRTSTSSPSPTRSISPNKRIISRNTSPVLTERSVSTYGGSCWEAESCISKKISHRSRYQESKRGLSPSNAPNVDMELIDRIVFDTKHGPAAYFDVNWETNRIEKNAKNFKNLYDVKKSRSCLNPVPAIGNTKRKSLNRSRICPQKRMFIPKMENEDSSRTPVECNIKQSQCKCSETCSCERNENLECKCKSNKEQSQTSSRDSAYNGGVSSLPESRSPTPDQKKAESCRCKPKSQELGDESTEESEVIHPINISTEYEVSDDKEENKGKKPKDKSKITRHSPVSPKYAKHFKSKSDQESLKKIKEEALYTKLIEDITSEVLQKGLYTNKALKKVMKRHLAANVGILDKDRMLKEVDNLRIQLGIPEDDSLLNLQTDAVADSYSDVRESCPVISDSAFATPQEDPLTLDEIKHLSYSWTSHHYLKKKQPDEYPPEKKKLHKSFSEVVESAGERLNDEKFVGFIDTDESVSVIQLKKMLEKTKTSTPNYSASYPNKTDDTSSEEDAEKITKRRKSRRESPVRRRSVPSKPAKTSDSSDESEDEKTVKEILPKSDETKNLTESPKKKNVYFSPDESKDEKKKESVSVLDNESQQGNKLVNALYLKPTRGGSFDPSPLFEESEFVIRVDDSASTLPSSEGSKLTTNSGKI